MDMRMATPIQKLSEAILPSEKRATSMQKGKCGNKERQSLKRCPADKNEFLIYYFFFKYHMCY
ncbi:hypothetical protein DESC_610043 [Desulfosarcina cetonica]|nr:hypothetical protein DESC_610043 [Desulfosarcina cetonica]